MSVADIPGVLEIESRSFPTPWGESSFRQEIRDNPYAHLFVVTAGGRGRVVAFACVWIVDQEMKINNIAVHPRWRRRGIGRRLLAFLLEFALRQRCLRASLEVRPSNEAALRLYRSAGFRPAGLRRDYYSDTHEDALILASRLRECARD
ncbi:MAG: ribosomal protein S18-alanine N-acetyltransferase [Acidobacteriota bacterium]